MRRVVLPAVLIALAVVLAACSTASEPGWTYAPASPSAPAGAAPSDGASAAPSGEPSAVPSEDGGSGGEAVAISAVNIAFDQSEVEAPADTPFTIRFENNDSGVPHNVEIKDANNQSVFQGEIFNGVATRDYAVPALPAGEYTFVCTVHPNMTGTLSVG